MSTHKPQCWALPWRLEKISTLNCRRSIFMYLAKTCSAATLTGMLIQLSWVKIWMSMYGCMCIYVCMYFSLLGRLLKLNYCWMGSESWHAIKKLFNLRTIPDSQGQVSNNKVSYRVTFIIEDGCSNDFQMYTCICNCL